MKKNLIIAVLAILVLGLAIGLYYKNAEPIQNNPPVQNQNNNPVVVNPVTPSTPTPEPALPLLKLTSADNGTTVTAESGQNIEISLGNPGDGGYQFDNPEFDTSILHLNSHYHTPPDVNAPIGNFGSDVWQFTALKGGTTDVTITATRPWTGGGTVTNFKATIAIK